MLAKLFQLQLRERFLVGFFDFTNPVHAMIHYKRIPWNLNAPKLLGFPKDTLGYQLGVFLSQYNLTPFAKAEKHDVFHVLLGYGTDVKSEASMQFFLLGNGKISPFTLGTSFLAAAVLPEHWEYFYKQFKEGKKIQSLKNWDFKSLLEERFADIQLVMRNIEVQNNSLMNKINKFNVT